MATKIEWANFFPGYKGETWNPVAGCTKVSAGCDNCYALRESHRMATNPALHGKYQGTTKYLGNKEIAWSGLVKYDVAWLQKPREWTKPRFVFVDSMSDLFHPDVPFTYIERVFQVMSYCEKHIFLVLTKRPERMLEYYQRQKKQYFGTDWAPNDNIWLGVSIENQKAADERLPLLLEMPASVRVLSCEPLLGPVDISSWLYPEEFLGMEVDNDSVPYESRLLENDIHWVIAGGESGPDARPMHTDWARGLRDQCAAAGVPFFFKQWGEWLPNYQESAEEVGPALDDPEEYFPDLEQYHIDADRWQSWWSEPHRNCKIDNLDFRRYGKRAAGRLLDHQEHNAYPQITPAGRMFQKAFKSQLT